MPILRPFSKNFFSKLQFTVKISIKKRNNDVVFLFIFFVIMGKIILKQIWKFVSTVLFYTTQSSCWFSMEFPIYPRYNTSTRFTVLLHTNVCSYTSTCPARASTRVLGTRWSMHELLIRLMGIILSPGIFARGSFVAKTMANVGVLRFVVHTTLLDSSQIHQPRETLIILGHWIPLDWEITHLAEFFSHLLPQAFGAAKLNKKLRTV